MIKILYSNIGDWSLLEYQRCLEHFPAETRSEIERYQVFKDKASRLAGKALLLKATSDTSYAGAGLLEIERETNRKPFLSNWMPFSISHSGDIVVLAFGEGKEIGVDIEYKDSRMDVTFLATHFCQEEQDMLARAEKPAELFFELWVRKEAVLKGSGIGITRGLGEFGCIKDRVRHNGQEWLLKKLEIDPAYASCLAVQAEQEVEIEQVLCHELRFIASSCLS
jgi:4'-phosphopantetheinyl transferase